MRILIAEDDLTSRVMLAAVLGKGGHEVLETEDGMSAWTELQKADAPKLVILDWMMPQVDGLEVVRRLRALPTDQPAYVIMLTTRHERGDLVAGFDAGVDDYLAKPFNPGELYARVRVGQRILEYQQMLSKQVSDLSQALTQIKTLQGIIPICSFCKNIRDDKGYWNQVEAYVSLHSQARFSHSVCPKCLKEHYADFVAENPQNVEDDY